MTISAHAWRARRHAPSLAEVHRSVPVRTTGSRLRRFAAYAGPGYLVAVGYMDPGNWATGVAGGSAFGCALLWVVVLASAMAMLLQTLAARLGIATGRDLAQACRATYGPRATVALWLLCELAICATDLAEVAGTAIALELLFGIPLRWGVALTGADVLAVLALQRWGVRMLEATTIALVLLVLGCFAVELALAHPSGGAIARGLVPGAAVVRDPHMLYLAVGILGATVMPHSLYLHSSVVQTRRFALDPAGRREAARFATADAIVALVVALAVNAAILVVSAAAFHRSGHHAIEELSDAYRLLSPAVGAGAASVLFGVALLAAGKSSTTTATLAGQIVMEGFLALSLPPWLRRLATRALAVVPALAVAWLAGDAGVARLLLLSQAVLSLQLPFAVVPLVRLTSDRTKMGELANPRWLSCAAWAVAAVVLGLDLILVVLSLI